MPKPNTRATPEQPLKGKYDGRRIGPNRFRIPHRKGINSYRKPEWIKNLGAKHAADLITEFDAVIPPATIYQQALDKKDLRLCWEMREAVLERLLGKPFVAVNPDTEPSGGHILNQDNRLQVAVSNLIVQASDSKGPKTRKRDQLVLEASSAQSGDRAQSVDNKDFIGFDDVVL
jgi:hypothetical protein